MTLSQQLSEYISACFTGLWVQSHEHDDALAEIAQLCRDQDWRMATWDIAQGLQIPGQSTNTDAGGSDPLAAIQTLSALATPDSSALLVLALSSAVHGYSITVAGSLSLRRLFCNGRIQCAEAKAGNAQFLTRGDQGYHIPKLALLVRTHINRDGSGRVSGKYLQPVQQCRQFDRFPV